MFRTYDSMDTRAFGDAHFADPDEVQEAKLEGTEGIRLGYYRVPGHRKGWGTVIRYNGDGGLITVAGPRGGKFRDTLAAALLDPHQSRCSAIIVDPKGQLAAVTAPQRMRMGHDVIFLNPYNVWSDLLGPSARYNAMKLLDPLSGDLAADCRKLAEGLIAPNNSDKGAQHWIDGARGLLTGVIGGLVAHGSEETQNLAYVRDVICSDKLLLKYARASQKSEHAFVRQELASYTMAEPRNPAELAGFIQNARVQTSFLGLEKMADNVRGHDFRFARLKDKPTTVYIILPDNRLDVCGRWFRLTVASALDDLWRGGKGKCRVLAVLDEMAAIGHLDVLESAAATAAGRGIQLWPIYQNIPQIKKDYGDVWETFMSGSEVQMFFRNRDPTSADYVAKQAGTRTVITAGQSVNNTGALGRNNESDSSGQTGQPLIRPHEVSGLGPNESIIFGPRNIVVNALRRPYFHEPELAGLYDPDPLHMNDPAPPPPINPRKVITFADALFACEERAARTRKARRPMMMRLLTWGQSRNPFLNALLKVEYVLTLPLRLLLALLAVPFAIHNRPLGAMVGFMALFGFWEVFNALAKEPIVALYQRKSQEYQTEAIANNRNSMGDDLNSHYKAAKWLLGLPFRTELTAVARPSSGATKASDAEEPAAPKSSQNPFDRAVKEVSGALDQERRETLAKTMRNTEMSVDQGTKEAFRRAEAESAVIEWVNEAEHKRRLQLRIKASQDGLCGKVGVPSCAVYLQNVIASEKIAAGGGPGR